MSGLSYLFNSFIVNHVIAIAVFTVIATLIVSATFTYLITPASYRRKRRWSWKSFSIISVILILFFGYVVVYRPYNDASQQVNLVKALGK
ncbi:hypothetical protein DmLsi_28730 [Lactiplantibacillus plantarum]|nr:hypothetical protein [Lactiplantibacillus plantarum]MCT3271769.1 hypothetical protein [Lactiplantibacillus plantarum]GFF01070.1 hypothetical protein DmLsi_28730 [Lactiplantibacillus plantarum]